MLVLKSHNHYLHEGPKERTFDYYCPHFGGDLLGARLFESEKQMFKWLKDETNYQPWRLKAEQPEWKLVPYTQEAADLITKLIERMA
jgi:hypothetical protein